MRLLNGLMLAGIATFTFAGCGGGGGDNAGGSQAAAQSSPVVITVNKDGLSISTPNNSLVSYAQNSRGGYYQHGPVFTWGGLSPSPPFRPGDSQSITAPVAPPAPVEQRIDVSSAIVEWNGINLGYSSGYALPTSGIIESFSVRSNELWYSIQNARFDLSRSPLIRDPAQLRDAILANARETKIFGGPRNDVSVIFFGTSEVDLQGGDDSLEFAENFAMYKFQRLPGQANSVIVTRPDMPIATQIKNVERFKFADGTKTLAQILATLP